MDIQERQQGAVTIIKPEGPLVGEDAAQFSIRASELARTNMGRVVLDSAAIAYLDSAGLEAVLDLGNALELAGRTLCLCSANETVREVLDLTGISDHFDFYDDVTSAVRSFL